MTKGNLVVWVLVAAFASFAGADPGAAPRPGATVKHPSHARPRGKPSESRPPEHAGAAARTLEDIHIEGEIPVPQVLFITARDQRRFIEFQHRRYLRTSRKLGEDTVLPSRIVVTGVRPGPDQEDSR